jgi:hypothetical protein
VLMGRLRFGVLVMAMRSLLIRPDMDILVGPTVGQL